MTGLLKPPIDRKNQPKFIIIYCTVNTLTVSTQGVGYLRSRTSNIKSI
ncbi:MAG: hypothetical protein ACRC62_17875 [Microcoleus sp.]